MVICTHSVYSGMPWGVGVRLYNTERFSKRRGVHNFSQRMMKLGSAVVVD